MTRIFNVNGTCRPDLHYMVDLSSRLAAIKTMVDAGNYFTINRARQYGKTTTLTALANYLMPDYDVISLDFQGISSADFESERLFVAAFSRQVIFTAKFLSSEVGDELTAYATAREKDVTLSVLFMTLLRACSENNKKIVLLIDEVDSASNNQVFLDFLAQLRYLCTEPGKEFMRLKPHPARATDRGSTHSPYPICLMRSDIVTFQSVIFAGIYDVRNLKRKIHPDEDSKYNSPWNIAVDFTVDMGFSPEDIATMLRQYEDDWHTGMDIDAISQLLYDYTRGYPYLVTRLCQIMAESMTGCESAEEKIKCWNQEAFQNAVCELLKKPNTLFDDMSKKLADYPKLKEMIYSILFQGKKYSYEAENERIRIGEMFGFLQEREGTVCISNRIFEMKLYNLFLSEEETDTKMFTTAEMEKNQFVRGGCLQMELILKKFCEYFEEIYSDADDRFIEDNGRRIFLIFLKPIINGSGNYYIESRTRNMKRTDVIIDYKGIQEVLEMKIWHGQEYNKRGENQLLEYMEYYHLQKGYMLSFNFNKKKTRGMKSIMLGDKVLVEAVV